MSKLNNFGLTVSQVIKDLQQFEASGLGEEEVCMHSAFGGVTIARAVKYDGTVRGVFLCDSLDYPYSNDGDDGEKGAGEE